jgi:5-(carboxyamino)imidazole ribonucleotide synthase
MSSSSIYSKIGVLGGGQLGKMMAQAAADWNLDLSILDPSPSAPASVCADLTLGDFRRYEDVLAFGLKQDLITIEIEDVSLEALKKLEQMGKKVYPSASSIELIQDKGLQKLFYQSHGLATADFLLAESKAEIIQWLKIKKISFPFVQKLRKAGYDGRGVQIIQHADDLKNIFEGPSVVESKVDLAKEIAVLAGRNWSGEVVTYDPVEMIFHPTANLLLYQECPSTLTQDQITHATQIAHTLIEKMDIVGLLAVEMFLDQEGKILINEVAPRPHNSGHHTIEACVTSQFQQHLRCILDLPLGKTHTLSPSILLNILGEPGFTGIALYQGIEKCLAIPGVHIHLYGKKETKPMRKMGHVTITGKDLDHIKQIAQTISQTLKVIA